MFHTRPNPDVSCLACLGSMPSFNTGRSLAVSGREGPTSKDNSDLLFCTFTLWPACMVLDFGVLGVSVARTSAFQHNCPPPSTNHPLNRRYSHYLMRVNYYNACENTEHYSIVCKLHRNKIEANLDLLSLPLLHPCLPPLPCFLPPDRRTLNALFHPSLSSPPRRSPATTKLEHFTTSRNARTHMHLTNKHCAHCAYPPNRRPNRIQSKPPKPSPRSIYL